MAVAFRCKNCGRLEEPGQAGERDIPRGCRVCGRGTHFEIDAAGNPISIDDPGNWEVLSELPAAKLDPILKRHALKRADIVKHKPVPAEAPARAPQHIERTAEDVLGAEDNAG